MKISILYRLWIGLMCLIFPLAAMPQQVQVSLNRNQILIGEQIDLGLKVSLPKGQKAAFKFPDSIPHFEILEKKEVRIVKGENAVEQVIIITSFDSGQFYFPSIPVLISDGINTKKILSDSVLINIGYAADNPLEGLRDIKPVRYLEIKDYFWYYFLGIMIVLFILLFLLYDYISKRKKKPVEQFKHSAFEEAMLSLSEVEKSSLHNQQDIRKFHAALSEIFKKYYGRKTAGNLYNKSTSDILIMLQEHHPQHTTAAASILRANDAVSFAKYYPAETESRNVWSNLRSLIQQIENQKENTH